MALLDECNSPASDLGKRDNVQSYFGTYTHLQEHLVDPDRWRQIENLYHNALACSEPERDTFISLCR
jgi:hypothetical protein